MTLVLMWRALYWRPFTICTIRTVQLLECDQFNNNMTALLLLSKAAPYNNIIINLLWCGLSLPCKIYNTCTGSYNNNNIIITTHPWWFRMTKEFHRDKTPWPRNHFANQGIILEELGNLRPCSDVLISFNKIITVSADLIIIKLGASLFEWAHHLCAF